jgi:hypothetical protein
VCVDQRLQMSLPAARGFGGFNLPSMAAPAYVRNLQGDLLGSAPSKVDDKVAKCIALINKGLLPDTVEIYFLHPP